MVLEFAIAVLVAAMTSLVFCRAVIAAGIEDAPVSLRKVHASPVATSGGLAIAAGVAAGMLALTQPAFQTWAGALPTGALGHLGAAMAISIGFLIVGAIDDVRALGPLTKFGAFAALAVCVALFVARVEYFTLTPHIGVSLGAIASVLGSALFVFTMVNTVNFIDGANGLSAGSVGIGLAGLAAAAVVCGAAHAAALALCGVGALLGFLYWNFPRARLFAGDSGALFIGAIAACAGLLLVVDGGVSPFVPPMFFFPMLADVLLTLAWRLPRRPKLLEGHRDHHFHIGLRAGLGHTRVSIVYWIVTAHCAAVGFVTAAASRGADDEGFGAIVGYLPLTAFLVLAAAALQTSTRIRKFAKARGYDAP
jgi:UDP-N-acetylmuramyl pentapeptide phosphotransferase/UDP-N-acetylglucosamine-1-phosphate transferase